jgi:N-acyl-D-aspartate/D-glutamate deacylase
LNFEFQLSAPFLFESMEIFKPISVTDDLEEKKRVYRDPEFRAEFRARTGSGALFGNWDATLISECPTEPELNERNLAEVASERGVDAADLVLDLGLASNLDARFRMGVMNTDEKAVADLIAHPSTMLGLSDAGAHASQLCDAPFATDLLSRWVREKEVLTLEQAVRLLTSRAADIFGITDRGRLREGLAADVTIFDPDTVGCSPLRRVHDQPAGADRLISEARGVRAVIVNGTVIREEGTDVVDPEGDLPGTVLRGGRA